MQEKWNEILKPGTIAEVRNSSGIEIYVILDSRPHESFIDRFYRYNCLVMDRAGRLQNFTFHQNELYGYLWYSRSVRFIR